jgi:hypothetical protein
MQKTTFAAFIIALSSLGSGCAALSHETLISELSTSRIEARAIDLGGQANARTPSGAPAGSPCQFGGDCLSSLCEAQVCVRTTLEERRQAAGNSALAENP